MIEINIPVEAAVNLLRDQVNLEVKRQKRIGKLDTNLSLVHLEDFDLKKVVEIALFDILVLLPVTIVTEESNLSNIIVKAVRALSVAVSYTHLTLPTIYSV